MKAAPIPLFNYRKRQCQAILSDPQQLATSVSTPINCADAGSDRRPSAQTSTSSNQNLADVNSKINRNADQTAMLLSLTKIENRKPVSQTNIGLMNIKGQFVARGTATDIWSKSGNQGKPDYYNQSMLVNGHSQGHRLPGGNTAALHGVISMVSGSSASMRQPLNIVTTSSSSTTLKNKLTTAGFTANHRMASVRARSSGSAMEATCSTISDNQRSKYELSGNWNKDFISQRAASTISQVNNSLKGVKNGPTKGSQIHFKTQSNNRSNAQWDTVRSIQQKTKNEPKNSNMDTVFNDELSKQISCYGTQATNSSAHEDFSLHIFTCTIAMLKSWSPKQGHLSQVMFEVYGVIDSALVRDRSGTGKEFVLRDDTSTITCIFYEIDREIPRLIRGQMCRVVGSKVDRLDVLRAVSVRSTNVDERLVCQTATELSRAEMDRLAT